MGQTLIFLDSFQIVWGGFGHTWELPTSALIKRHHHSPALSRTAAGNNTKERGFANCLHTCRGVEVSQLATHCLPTMYERKQLKMGGGGIRVFVFENFDWLVADCLLYSQEESKLCN